MGDEDVRAPTHDITGMQFGRLTPVIYLGESKWHCICCCGMPKQVITASLRNGSTKSCGCLRREAAAESARNKKKHGMCYSTEYQTWSGMHARCTNPNYPDYECWGGRGVRVSPEWDTFEAFYRDMGPRPSKAHSLDRIDNGLLYSKDTCRWATQTEQHNNKRSNRLVTHNGETKTLSEWARISGINYQAFWQRLKSGWPFEQALTRPLEKHRPWKERRAAEC